MRLIPWGNKPAPRAPEQVPDEPVVLADDALYLQLDSLARVRVVSPALQAYLPALAAGSALTDYLAQPVGWLRGGPQAWPAQIPLLPFRARDGGELAMSGWLCHVGELWLLCLLDLSDPLQRLAEAEQRQQLFARAWHVAEQLNTKAGVAIEQIVGEWLDEMQMRLQVRWLAIALPAEGHWSLFQQARMPGFSGVPWDDRELQILLGESPQAAERVQAEGLWRLAYREKGRTVAWLIAVDAQAPARLSYMQDTHWSQLFALLAAPLLHQIREQERTVRSERRALLQYMLGSGWWEFNVPQASISVAPHLLERLGVEWQENGQLGLDSWLELVDPLDRQEFKLRLDDAVMQGQSFTQSLRLGPADHSRWYRLQVEAMQGGRHRSLMGFLLDINDIRQKESEAALDRARLEALVDSAPAIIYVQRYQEGALVLAFCSASLKSVLGWQFEDLPDASLAALLHPADRDVFFAHTHALLRDGIASCRYRLRDRDNRYHWMIDEARLLRDDRGLPHEVVGLCLDVTETTEATEQVRRSEERYRVLVEDSPAMICRYRPDLTLTFANAPLLNSLGVDLDQPVNLGEYLLDEQRQGMLARLKRLTPEHPVSTAELCIHLPGQDHAWWVWSDRGLFDEQGCLVEVQAVGRDNTEVHQARQQLYQSAKMATLGEMATGLAHEINQPLNVMRMALVNMFKRLENHNLTPEYLREKLERVEAQVTRAARIVDHVRIFGRRSDIEGALFEPARAVEGALSLVKEGLDKAGVVLQVTMSDLPVVAGHCYRLEQVLINLLLNAQYVVVKRRDQEPGFMPHIRISGEVQSSQVVLSIQDNGGGIAPGLLERVFEPFVTTKPVGEGTGLGLSVSYGIINQMRGRLWAHNVEDGACFVIELPADHSLRSA